MEQNMQKTPRYEEITVKFAKGLVSEPFTAHNGTECVGIKIPNADPADKRPWASVITAAKNVHENKFGKGMWMKIPADGQMKVYRSEITGQTPDGKNVYTKSEQWLSNQEIKNMLESYKTRTMENEKPSIRDALNQPGIAGSAASKHTHSMER